MGIGATGIILVVVAVWVIWRRNRRRRAHGQRTTEVDGLALAPVSIQDLPAMDVSLNDAAVAAGKTSAEPDEDSTDKVGAGAMAEGAR